MAEFITSDLHIGHANIWKPEYANRPVSSTEEHDEFLVSNWNEIVRPEDFIYVLGDVCMGKIAESLPRLGSLNGTKILVFGNHDRMFHPKNETQLTRWMTEYGQYFNEITNEMVWNGEILFNHFPYQGDHTEEIRFLEDRPKNEGMWLCHGHIHSKEFRSGPRQIHIGVDAEIANFAPIPMELIIEEVTNNGIDS